MKRLVAIALLLTIAGCAAAPPKLPTAPAAKKSQGQKTTTAPGQNSELSPLQAQRQDGKYAFDMSDNTPIEILPDEILIVGRIKLSPLLVPEEQERLPGKLVALRGKAVMVRDLVRGPLPPENDLASADTFEVTLDRDFLLTLPHDAVALLGGYVYVSDDQGRVDPIRLPGSWQLGIRPRDRAIYIGTIHYVRSEYDTILDYIVEDNYPQAYEAYQHRLEEGIILRKELVVYSR